MSTVLDVEQNPCTGNAVVSVCVCVCVTAEGDSLLLIPTILALVSSYALAGMFVRACMLWLMCEQVYVIRSSEGCVLSCISHASHAPLCLFTLSQIKAVRD